MSLRKLFASNSFTLFCAMYGLSVNFFKEIIREDLSPLLATLALIVFSVVFTSATTFGFGIFEYIYRSEVNNITEKNARSRNIKSRIKFVVYLLWTSTLSISFVFYVAPWSEASLKIKIFCTYLFAIFIMLQAMERRRVVQQ